MSTPPGSGSGSGIAVQAPINVLLIECTQSNEKILTVQASIHILEEDLPHHVR